MLSVLSLNFKHLEISSYAVHMVSFENFVKLASPSLSELKVTPSFCFAFKIPDNVTASTEYVVNLMIFLAVFALAHSKINQIA